MSTITENEKRLLAEDDRAALASGNARLREDADLAERFAHRLVELARMLVPERQWTLEELREALEIAARSGPAEGAQALEGRLLRKRLVEQCSLARQYGDGFGCIVVAASADLTPFESETIVRAAVGVLRGSDMAFVYRRRIFLVLPRLRLEAFPSLVDRVREAVDRPSVGVPLRWASRFFGGPGGVETNETLDWAEDQLRDFG